MRSTHHIASMLILPGTWQSLTRLSSLRMAGVSLLGWTCHTWLVCTHECQCIFKWLHMYTYRHWLHRYRHWSVCVLYNIYIFSLSLYTYKYMQYMFGCTPVAQWYPKVNRWGARLRRCRLNLPCFAHSNLSLGGFNPNVWLLHIRFADINQIECWFNQVRCWFQQLNCLFFSVASSS